MKKEAEKQPRTARIAVIGKRFLTLSNTGEAARVTNILRGEVLGGVLVMIAALLGFIAANTPLADWYFGLRETHTGPALLGLNLSIGHWASDGLLAIFFFMVGLELKREFVEGALSRIQTAIVPIAAAVGGVAVPALIYLAFNLGQETEHGWAIPTATDIAFAVAVLGLIAPRIPPALRMFILTLAVVDDLIAIAIIAIFYSDTFFITPLLLSLIPIGLYWLLTHRATRWLARSRFAAWVFLLPLGVATWVFFHESGIHATIAGVVLAFMVPVSGRCGTSLAEAFEHRFRPLSSLFAVPVFAFFAAGVPLVGADGFPFDPVVLGVIVGLVAGKPVGISFVTWAVTRFTRAELDPAVRWRELIGVSALAGVGFTVSLLVTELSFEHPVDANLARLGVITGSLIAVGVASLFLARRK